MQFLLAVDSGEGAVTAPFVAIDCRSKFRLFLPLLVSSTALALCSLKLLAYMRFAFLFTGCASNVNCCWSCFFYCTIALSISLVSSAALFVCDEFSFV